MYRLIVVLCIFSLFSCPRTVTIEEPPVLALDQDLGSYKLSDLARNFVPYQTINTLVFLTADSTAYNFQMAAPQFIDNLEFQDVYPNPENPSQNVTYRYTSDIQRYTFTSSELGAMWRMEVRSSICGDPRLETDDIVSDYLLIRGLGFNSGDITILTPGFQLDITRDNFCGNGQRIGQYTALGKTFENVYTQSIDISDTGYLRLFLNKAEGIVAFETPEVFAVLDRKF